MLKTPVIEFLDTLASDAPTPGGGSVAALTAAMAAGLGSMVCNLTIGKPAYAAHEADLKRCLERLEQLRAELQQLAEDDVAAYQALSQAYKLPKDDDPQKSARSAAIQEALVQATDVPMRVAELSGHILEIVPILIEKGSKNAVSDSGMAGLLAASALRSAGLNVLINAKSTTDAERAQKVKQRFNELLGNRMQLALTLHNEVNRRIANGE